MESIKISHEYVEIKKAATMLGLDVRDLVHGGAFGHVQICVNLYGSSSGQKRTRIDKEDDQLTNEQLKEMESEVRNEIGDAQFEANKASFDAWWNRCSKPMPAGFFELDDEILRFFELPDTGSVELYEAYKRDELGWWSVEFDPPPVIRMRDLYLLAEEIDRLRGVGADKQKALPQKTLSTKERNTLLTIIAVLCKEAKFDYTKPAKTAGMILSTADKMGVSIGETTIENHLKKIPDALEARVK